MKWPKVKIGDVEYELSHLDPFVIETTPKGEGAPTFTVRVSFGCHVFTRERREGDPEDHIFRDGAEERHFCPLRHGHSVHLPDILRRNIGHVCFWDHGRFLIGREIEGIAHPYAVIFNLEKMKKEIADANVFVVTAFEKDDMPKRVAAISFPTLVSKRVRGNT